MRAADRLETVMTFRRRLAEALEQARINRSQLAQRAGIDRSTLSQLLAGKNTRLPRADTVAALATVLKVSADWLLGLSADARGGAAILAESLEIATGAQTPADDNLLRWHEEAAGYKIRYVPSTLPDLTKTDTILEYEFRDGVVRSADQAIAASRGRLAYSRMPETDLEVCMSSQTISVFARGEGIWSGLGAAARQDQLLRIADLCEELYPGFRLYLFDGLSAYSVPYTIFGPLRAAVFMGQMYFVFNTREHVRVLARHFDDLIRVAIVCTHDVADYPRNLTVEIPRVPKL
jgi:transcriptional regulator with XRE-family HTH domain